MDINRGSCLILIVEDYDDAREMYAEYLTFHGCRVVTAASGEEALRIATGPERPSLILMDLELRGGIDGTSVMHQLREDPQFRQVPILALTAHAMTNEIDDATRAGFDQVISKPCLPDELLKRIDPYLGIHSSVGV